MTGRYRSRGVAVEGGDLTVGTWDGTGTPVVALHGITSHHRSWPAVAAALPDVPLHAPDLRGRGHSRDLPGPWGMSRHAEDAAAVIRAVGGKAVVVGHSMGGFVGAVLAAQHPDLVQHLVLVDGGLPFAEAELEATRDGLQMIRQRLETDFASVDDYVHLFRNHPALTDVDGDVVDDYARYDTVGDPPRVRARALVDAVTADQEDILDGDALAQAWEVLGAPGTPPVTFLHAPRGFVDDPPGLYAQATADDLAERFPGVQVRFVDEVNHYTIVLSDSGAGAVADAVREAGAG